VNFTILDLSGQHDSTVDVSDRRDALEICGTLNAANPGSLWVIQQNV
jgi:hypothetical protein